MRYPSVGGSPPLAKALFINNPMDEIRRVAYLRNEGIHKLGTSPMHQAMVLVRRAHEIFQREIK